MKTLAWISILFLLISCSKGEKKPIVIEEVSLGSVAKLTYPELLSEWQLFKQPMKDLNPSEGIIPYTLNTPLFSDYALKARFVKIPKGKAALYKANEVMEFPEGTLLVKNFYYELDESKEESERRIVETRLLISEADEWKAITYIWNEEQTEAKLEIAGRTLPISWTDEKEILRNVNYSVPNQVQCKSCHELNGKQMPIGPTVRQLNRDFEYENGAENQLIRWSKLDMVKNLPSKEEWSLVPVWNDPSTGTLDERARAWLEINCAHCHRSEGPAKNSGLSLRFHETDPYKLGVYKPPVAAGRGSGGLKYSIVPGKPQESILYYRISSTDPGIMMPEVGRKLNHDEGIELIREWIVSMQEPS